MHLKSLFSLLLLSCVFLACSSESDPDGGDEDSSIQDSGGGGAAPEGREPEDPKNPGSRACAKGFWDADSDPKTPCVAHRKCVPGEFVGQPGSAEQDVVCSPCPEGSFSDSEGASSCQAWTVCPLQVQRKGSSEQDVVCKDKVEDLSLRDLHSCALVSGGRVACWGRNQSGQLGDGSTTPRSSPTWVEGLGEASSVAVGQLHSCARLKDETIACWGDNSYGQLGDGTTTSSEKPVAVAGLSGVRAVAAGNYFTCALLKNKTVQCWGLNANGALGHGGEENSSTPVAVSTLNSVQALSLGAWHACALLDDQTVQCWGQNESKQLGGGITASHSLVPVPVMGLRDVVEVSTQHEFSCALLKEGSVRCWGRNWDQQLGNSSASAENGLVTVKGVSRARSITAGEFHACAVLEDETVRCWGSERKGVLGNGVLSYEARGTAFQFSSLKGVLRVEAGRESSCALLRSGAVQCWGYLERREASNGGWGSPEIKRVDGLRGIYAIGVGGDYGCALLKDGTVQCWGANIYGQLGDGTVESRSIPAPVRKLKDVQSITVGEFHACALHQDETVSCWGYDLQGRAYAGQSGGEYLSPQKLQGLRGVKSITAGSSHSCAVLADETVRCWGNNGYGQLGGGTNEPQSGFVTVQGLQDARLVRAGEVSACALVSDESVQCWGSNQSGQLGDSVLSNSRNYPQAVSGLKEVVSLSLGDRFACAVLRGGTASCWGNNVSGQLGAQVSALASRTPVSLQGATQIRQLAAGSVHGCILLETGKVQCWGMNRSFQLGSEQSWVGEPETVVGIDSATAVAVNRRNSCALLRDETVVCWGDDMFGQLGRNPLHPLKWAP